MRVRAHLRPHLKPGENCRSELQSYIDRAIFSHQQPMPEIKTSSGVRSRYNHLRGFAMPALAGPFQSAISDIKHSKMRLHSMGIVL